MRRIQYEFAFRKLAERATSKGIACPRCGWFGNDHEAHPAEPVSVGGPQSYLTCKSCGGRFGPLDV